MANTLVGVFENYNQAQSAMNALLDSGFSRSNVRISSQGSDAQTTRMTSIDDQDSSNDSGGIGGFFRSLFGMNDTDEDRRVAAYSQAADRGNCIVTVDADSDDEADRAIDILNRFDPIDIDEDSIGSAESGITGTGYAATGSALTGGTRQMSEGGTLEGGATIPIIEEEVKVGKREVQRGGVRVYQRVTERPVQESLNLREEHVHVERHPVNQPATAADLNAFKEGSFELRETAEEAVVSKSARVVEEVVIGKEVSERTEQINDTVRRTDVDVEQLGTTGTTNTTGYGTSTTGTSGLSGTGAQGGMGFSSNMAETGTVGSSGMSNTSSGPSVASTTGVSGTSAAETYRMDTAGAGSSGSMTDDDEDYRRHYQSNYSAMGSSEGAYEDYAPAYRYGSTMAGNDQYRGQRWESVEPHLRSDWERQNPGSTWDKVKNSIRYGWDRMTK